MKNVDLSPLKGVDTEYQRLFETVSNSFKCDWEDAVHDSYERFVQQVSERAQALRTIRCKAEVLAKEAESLKIEDLIRKTNDLYREADSV